MSAAAIAAWGAACAALGAIAGAAFAVVGYVAPRRLPNYARVCAWCDRPMSRADAEAVRAGHVVTHTICPACARRIIGT